MLGAKVVSSNENNPTITPAQRVGTHLSPSYTTFTPCSSHPEPDYCCALRVRENTHRAMETRRRTPAVMRLQMDHTHNTSTQRVCSGSSLMLPG